MSNWKERARKLIAEANLLQAITCMNNNGVDTGTLSTQALRLEAESEKHAKNKTQFAPGEYAKHSAKFSKITCALLQKIDGTNKPMPEYLK